MENKKPWLSKTMWLNAIGGILAALGMFWPGASGVSGFITGHAMEIGLVWSIANLALRAVTKDKVSLSD